jgi:16S rRNA processing protein RimM
MPKISTPKYLQIGEILRPHGVHGELRMRVLTDYPERIPKLKQVYLGDSTNDRSPQTYHIQSMRNHNELALITFKEIPDRDAADRLRGLLVMIALEDAVPLEEGEVYLYQLIGMRAVSEDGQDLGELTEVIETGTSDTYVIKGAKYGEFTVPAVPQFIVKIDAEKDEIIIRLMDGLLPE